MNGNWEAFKGTDVQLEFFRIDPFIRITLNNSNGLKFLDFERNLLSATEQYFRMFYGLTFESFEEVLTFKLKLSNSAFT